MNIILIGASGSGKTWISNVFGLMYAWKDTEFNTLVQPDFFQEIEEAKLQGHYKKYMKKTFQS